VKRFFLVALLVVSFPTWGMDREGVLRELRDQTVAGVDRRLGPDYAFYHKDVAETFPKVWMPESKQEKGGRRYQIGGPWSKKAGDFSSTQGQVLYVPDAGAVGVDRVTIEEWSNNCFSERPEAPWWGGFRPEPTYAKWKAAARDPGTPLGMARGMASWANCGVIIFSSGLVGTAGTCTGHGSDPMFQFPPEKLLTGVSVTNKNEFALVTLHDTKLNKGQVAILAMESSGRVSKFAHEWRDDYPCLPNVAVFTRIKLLGYVDLPGMEFPTAVCAVGNHYGGRVNGLDGNAGVLRTFDLSEQRFRDMFYKGSNAKYSSSAGFAVVIGKYEQKAAFIDLQPLFERVRQMYFTTGENFNKTRDLGPAPGQWPYTFEADPTWKPPVVSVIDVDRPTAVIASMSGGAKARAMIASEDGRVGVYRVGGLATEEAAKATEIERVAEVTVGRNPCCLAYQKYTSDRIMVVSRGDREIDWIQYADAGAKVIRRLRDARMKDPVFVEQSDTHGIETPLMTVTDFKGRQIINYRFGQLVWATQGGKRFGMGPDGKAEFECGGVMEIPGSPFCVSAANVN
jgi:hypothetical protein